MADVDAVVDRLMWDGDEKTRGQTTRGQRALHSIRVFEAQVNNGGFAQYLHNCVDELPGLLDALPLLEWLELSERIQRILDAVPANLADRLAHLWECETESSGSGDDQSRIKAYEDWASRIDDAAFNEWFYASDESFRQKQAQMCWQLRDELIAG